MLLVKVPSIVLVNEGTLYTNFIAEIFPNRPSTDEIMKSMNIAKHLQQNAEIDINNDKSPIRSCAMYIDIYGIMLTISFKKPQE